MDRLIYCPLTVCSLLLIEILNIVNDIIEIFINYIIIEDFVNHRFENFVNDII